jgi:hypothetical protein
MIKGCALSSKAAVAWLLGGIYTLTLNELKAVLKVNVQ